VFFPVRLGAGYFHSSVVIVVDNVQPGAQPYGYAGYPAGPQGYMPPPAGAQYGAMPPGGGMYAPAPPPTQQQPNTYVVQGGFDAGARFDGISRPTIPVSSVIFTCHSLTMVTITLPIYTEYNNTK